MVQAVRHVEAALGDGHKHLTASEAPNKAIARKSIVAARPIKAGEVFTAENLLTKRPGDGISPMPVVHRPWPDRPSATLPKTKRSSCDFTGGGPPFCEKASAKNSE
mgnify:CR=1 FL=1